MPLQSQHSEQSEQVCSVMPMKMGIHRKLFGHRRVPVWISTCARMTGFVQVKNDGG